MNKRIDPTAALALVSRWRREARAGESLSPNNKAQADTLRICADQLLTVITSSLDDTPDAS